MPCTSSLRGERTEMMGSLYIRMRIGMGNEALSAEASKRWKKLVVDLVSTEAIVPWVFVGPVSSVPAG